MALVGWDGIFSDAAAESLRNGPAGDISPVHIGTGIPEAYYWINVGVTDNAPPAAAPAAPAVAAAPATTIKRVKRMAALIGARLAMMNQPPPDATRAAIARVIATARVLFVRRYQLGAGDLEVAQTAAVGGNFDGTANELVIGAYNPAGAGAPTAAAVAAADALWVPGENVQMAYTAVARMALAVPILNGVVLVRTLSHHFLDPYKVYFRAVVRQVGGPEYVPPGGLTMDQFEDALFHKAGHPITSTVLVALAISPESKERMINVGLGSAAVRVPALTDEQAAMSAIMSLFDQTRALMAAYNVDVGDYQNDLTDARDALWTGLAGGPRAAGARAAQNAATAFVDRNKATIAFQVGFLRGMVEGQRAVSLLKAKSLGRIADEMIAATSAGTKAYQEGYSWTEARTRAGALTGKAIYNGTAPASRTPPDSEDRIMRYLFARGGA